MTKYHNRKVTVDGIVFDSVKEASHYRQLKLLERAGKIHGLRTQVKYVLVPSQKADNKVIEREVAYYADFDYTDSNGVHIVEDTKGVRTKDYIIKRKLMLYIYGIHISEV